MPSMIPTIPCVPWSARIPSQKASVCKSPAVTWFTWNPMRLEQRNGRVDRHGQERDVYAFHFTSDDEADLQFMARVVEKVNQARSDLGSVGQVIDSAILQHFTQGTLSLETLEQCVQVATRDPQEQED